MLSKVKWNSDSLKRQKPKPPGSDCECQLVEYSRLLNDSCPTAAGASDSFRMLSQRLLVIRNNQFIHLGWSNRPQIGGVGAPIFRRPACESHCRMSNAPFR